MPSDRKQSRISPVAGAALLLLIGYVGSYYAMVAPEPVELIASPRKRGSSLSHPVILWADPVYSLSGQPCPAAVNFFSPIHRLDRRIRPHVWEPHVSLP